MSEAFGTFEAASLADLLDKTVAAVVLTNPPWASLYGDELLAAHVAQVIHTGAAEARKHATTEADGIYESGGIRVTFDATGCYTQVYVLMGYVNDPLEDDDDGAAAG